MTNNQSTQNNTPTKSFSERIMQSIEKEKVHMLPKWHFILRISLLVVGTILASLSLLYLVSFIIFALRQNGSWFAPQFGLEGWGILFVSLPWILIIGSIIFVIIVGVLVKKYSFAYGRPLLYSALGIISLASIGGFLIALSPFHSELLSQAEERKLPIAGPMYRQYTHQYPHRVIVGRIIEKIPNGFNLRDQEYQVIMVEITPRTILPPHGLSIEEMVIVMGDKKDSSIKAIAIKPLGSRSGMRPIPRNR